MVVVFARVTVVSHNACERLNFQDLMLALLLVFVFHSSANWGGGVACFL